MDLPDDLIVVNCARCESLLVTNERDKRQYGLSKIAGRIHGRPYCGDCLSVVDFSGSRTALTPRRQKGS